MIPLVSVPFFLSICTIFMPNIFTNALEFDSDHILNPASTSTASEPSPLTFQLRHLHTVSDDNRILFADVDGKRSQHNALVGGESSFRVRTKRVKASRRAARSRAAPSSPFRVQDGKIGVPWVEDEIVGPDVSDRETLLLLAKMTSDAYLENEEDPLWYDLGGGWTSGYPFGWDDDGFRGHVFATPDNSTIVIAIKGTSTAGIGGGGPTSKKDKFNDNLLFSCCCAAVGFTWTPVCGCHEGGWKCSQRCLEEALAEDSLFYNVGTNLYNNLTYMYPDSNIWLVGHSLGGSLAALLGATFGIPTVAYESPGERVAAARLHLPSPPSLQPVYHVYHTADPIPMGTCNGVFSPCAVVGFAFETRCHLGQSIIYDTVSEWNWGVSIRTHPIKVLIEQVLAQDWPNPPGGTAPSNTTEKGPVPSPKYEEDCVECYSWEFV